MTTTFPISAVRYGKMVRVNSETHLSNMETMIDVMYKHEGRLVTTPDTAATVIQWKELNVGSHDRREQMNDKL